VGPISPFSIALAIVFPAFGASAAGPPASSLGLVPRPERMALGEGAWAFGPASRVIAVTRGAEEEARKLADALSASFGRRIPVAAEPPGAGDIALAIDGSREDFGDEGYALRAGPGGVRIVALRPAGLFFGGVTLRQLLPAGAWRSAPAGGPAPTVPSVEILDRPRFFWRGLLLDPARHFIPKASLLAVIDAMAMHKLNRLQLHLTDDQGWRIEIRAFPRLAARSSWRDGTVLGHLGEKPQRISSTPHGGFYSQDDLREIVAYAAARHITVVPEIEMPGHARALLSAYPEFAVFPERARNLAVGKGWGISEDVLAPRPATVEACKRILDEVCEVFPSPWIHIGGDEAPRTQWKESDEIQGILRGLGLRSEDELQAWFTSVLSRHLAAKGRRLVGWDEILAGAKLGAQGGATALDPGAIVMSWRGEDGGRAAARAGHAAIMAPYAWTYLDYYQGPPAEEPVAIGGSVSLARAFSFEPVPSGLPEEAAGRILGAQTQVWGEYVSGLEAIGTMAFPRACALAETFWSPRDGKDLSDFLVRLERHEERLRAAGIPHHPLARRTSLSDRDGKILCEARDAVIHGAEADRRGDGSIAIKDPLVLLAWRIEVPAPGTYRVKVLGAPIAAGGGPWIEAVVAGGALRAAPAAPEGPADLGPASFDRSGSRLLFLRAGGTPGPEGLAAVKGVELVPETKAGSPR
jgi:hexosaminidase